MAGALGRIVTGTRKRLWAAVPGLIALIVIMVLQFVQVPQVERLGPLLFDGFQRAAPRPFEDTAVRVVDIDDETLKRLGQWPWPRSDVAELTRRLTDAGAAAIGFDVVFAEPDRTSPAILAARAEKEGAAPEALAALKALPDNDAVFAETLANSPVVLAYFLNNEPKGAPIEPKAGFATTGTSPDKSVVNFTNAIRPLKQLNDAAMGNGFVSLQPDLDGIVRKPALLAAVDGQLLPSLAAETLRVAQGAGSIIVKSSDASGELGADGSGSFESAGSQVASLKIGDFEIPTTARGEFNVYYTKPAPQRIVPAWKILTGALTPEQMEQEFGGRIVLIGTGAAGLRDLVSTPVAERELGVVVHAQVIEQVLLKKFLVRPYDKVFWFETMGTPLLGLLLALLLPFLGAIRGAVVGILLSAGMVAASWLAFRQGMMLLDPTYPVLAILAVYVTSTAFTYYREEKQRAYIHQAFDRYLSPDLVQRIVDDPSRLELGGEEREMTVLFCDVRSFSAISEKLSPQEIIRFLIAFLTPMCDILLARKATIDKFIGDAILAFWNAPLDDPDQYGNAARGALAMVDRLKQLNREMPGGTEPWPGEVSIGIGLNAGPCCVGNMGSAQRLSYSLIGDTVNLASRIEGLTKYYGVPILMGSALQERLREFATLPVDLVRVVGRDAPEQLHVLLGDEAMAAAPAFGEFAKAHEAMLNAYRAQDWDAAQALADQGIEGPAAAYGLVKLYALIQGRIALYRENPPGADWDGVYQATEK
ncbi:CHASE2 domain-containing protein [Sphingomonas canadensis]|uniref:CHASE2 domain-containing protein n=1 Tax=Sphingomonas canadensis TaxID=1219257 RepID=A0ABW3HAQ0_9SPHN|nr:adenylate/guanylate cyclase domain-containing protein [Sphingomonas canadensis]MCW3837375.1 adenylate/guanylate cyclase domain-containing protein [Sphingomonas canadensis]